MRPTTLILLFRAISALLKIWRNTRDLHTSYMELVLYGHIILAVAYRGGCVGGFKPPENQALQNRAKLNPIVKTVKTC